MFQRILQGAALIKATAADVMQAFPGAMWENRTEHKETGTNTKSGSSSSA